MPDKPVSETPHNLKEFIASREVKDGHCPLCFKPLAFTGLHGPLENCCHGHAIGVWKENYAMRQQQSVDIAKLALVLADLLRDAPPALVAMAAAIPHAAECFLQGADDCRCAKPEIDSTVRELQLRITAWQYAPPSNVEKVGDPCQP